ncbi:Ger(x)C family spore germination protein [Paenibacillus sp. DMB5]|uniref:Ger(x)C family spore germination protein n=1 Tax=Paenibacillus sp. DMB5 TaxID=1780103 RepID=UPI00076D5124|nr:Ger(x)C family spore germination protein [Paenibacillus sp. DMB5]KUP25812.1 hypothetical protein AWJ19_19505 [Paenibacillus sp. DMB5]
MMRNCLVAFVAVITLMSLTGCGRATELNDLSIATGIGVEGSDGNYSVTYQVSVASSSSSALGGASGSGSQAGVHVFTTKGKTIQEAISRSAVEEPRKIFFAHNSILILSKEIAENGITPIFDSFFRNPDFRETAHVLVTEGKAKDILTKNIPPEKQPGRALSEIIEKERYLVSFYPTSTVFELALAITSPSKTGAVPEVGISGENAKELESSESMTKTSQQAKLRLTGLIIFKGDRSVGRMNAEESLGLSWLTNRVKGTTLSFPNSNEAINKNQSAVKILKSKVKITPVKGPFHYSIKVKADVTGELTETTTQEELSETLGIDILKREIEKVILNQMEMAWASSKAMNVDILGIGNMIHAQNPKEWHKLKPVWEEELARIDMNAEVKVDVVRTRLFINSFQEMMKKTLE